MIAAVLPSSHSCLRPAGAPLVSAYQELAAAERKLLTEWRVSFTPSPRPSARALFALEQFVLPRPQGEGDKPDTWREHLHYTAARLAKLGVPLRLAHQALACFRPLAVRRLRLRMGAGATRLESELAQQSELILAEAYVNAQGRAVAALLTVLDAELGAGGLDELLGVLLRQAAQLFPVRWGEVLLLEGGRGATPHPDRMRLRHAASFGLAPGMIHETAGVGAFFDRVLRRGEPAFLLDAANDPRVAQPYYRALEIKSVWAVPLWRRAPHREPLGVLSLAFDRIYECLPQEKDLLLALAERSTLAIERTRMHERLGRERARVSELSRRLLAAQEEERRRISRDLHDETGQALLALRLYLEMGLRQNSPAGVRPWLHKGLALVDRSVADLRRIMARLSPLVLDELGLEAALRLELRQLRESAHWRTRFHYCGPARLEPAQEILIYRVVLEGLRNAARHARAARVQLRVSVGAEAIRIRLRDDGVGLAGPTPVTAGRLGLAGMRERVRLAGGRLEYVSAPGRGLLLDIQLPRAASAPAAASALHPPHRAAHAS